MNNPIILKASNIYKSFSGVEVLHGVNFEVAKGEVHALMGENGAGKSTLIKIITGAYTKDAGTIELNGKTVNIESRKDSERLGISAVYQELSSIPTLTVAQNIFLGRQPKNILGLIDHKKLNHETYELIKKYNFPLEPTALVETLSIAQRQLLEILKALATEAPIIIMDEPTASLSASESELLFDIIINLKNMGIAIIYISHRLEEVYRLSDRLTVLRDGNNVKTLAKDEINPKDVIQLMIGKNITPGSVSGNLKLPTGEVGLQVRNLTSKGLFRNISFDVHRGEILGIGGLVGSGRTEILRALFGADKFDSGEIKFLDKPYKPSIKSSIKNGFGFVPEDRRIQGFVGGLSTQLNIAMPNYDFLSKISFVSSKKEKTSAINAINKIHIRPARTDIHVINLSGGNQQKVVLGKWLERDLSLLLIDEPTAGIDIGAKDEIYSLVNELANKGIMIILVSSDLPELIQLSHRIVVLRNGSIIQEFTQGSVTETDVLEASSGIFEDKEVV